MLDRIGIIASARRRFLMAVVAGLLAMLAPGLAFAQQTPQASASPQAQPALPAAPGRALASVPPPGEGLASQPSDYKLGSGDHVRITVFGQSDLSNVYLVDGAGMLSFPLIGGVSAGGLTANQLEKLIVSKLKPDYIRDPKVSVEILAYRPFYIVGEVKVPGSYAFVSGMSVINAVALAGGFTYRAREDDFYLSRSDTSGKKVRIDATPETRVQPGDVITVRERFF